MAYQFRVIINANVPLMYWYVSVFLSSRTDYYVGYKKLLSSNQPHPLLQTGCRVGLWALHLAGFSESIATTWPTGCFRTRTRLWNMLSMEQQLPASVLLPSSTIVRHSPDATTEKSKNYLKIRVDLFLTLPSIVSYHLSWYSGTVYRVCYKADILIASCFDQS